MARDYGHPVRFGAFITPDATNADRTVGLARTADRLGLDVLGVQDHPYHAGFLDTWTFLSALARDTERIILFPDVANLPLRPPAVLARSVATLDLLSGGRVELGLGAGAFAEGIRAMDGPVRTPGESVDALEEAIGVIRALWAPGRGVRLAGRHYSLYGARPGPVPLHPVGIWLGAYKPRMLRLTGRLADGWVPSSQYASPDEIAEMAKTLDAAAEDAGRDPAAIRRWYNITGSFSGHGAQFLQGPPRVWVEQLTDLAVTQGVSGFILAPGTAPESELQRFAEEVAPGVREAVAAARGTRADIDTQQDLAPADRTTGHHGWLDESTRPRTDKAGEDANTIAASRGAQALVYFHDNLRRELEEIRGVIDQVAAGHANPLSARSLINRMSMRQNYWSLGAFCAQYCRVVTVHHTIEDQRLFPDLRSRDAGLGAVLDRLGEEHESIAGILTRLDEALVGMVGDDTQLAVVRAETERLAEALLSHLDYEEDELLGAIARLGIEV
jgi:alkanesulfonate monooxygenase SsuD/methylene tetrahydromethanopterin reductase-like flavin-dependent oxidoreductase (luciferase family)/hemerythrin-like domain-containing protein